MAEAAKSNHLLKNILCEALILAIALVLSAGIAFLVLFDAAFGGKVYPRINVAGENIGNLEPKSAQRLLEERLNLWQNRKINIDYNEAVKPSGLKKWEVEPEKLGIASSSSKTILLAYNKGRIGGFPKTLWQKIKIIAVGENLPPYYDFDERRFESYINGNFSFLEKPAKNASLAFVEGRLKEIPAENGYKIDRDDFKKKTISNIVNLGNNPVSIEMTTSIPEITNQKIEQAKQEATSLAESEILLQFEDKSWTLDPELAKASIAFEPIKPDGGENGTVLGFKINLDLITDYLEKIQMEVNRKPADAVLGAKDDNLVIESGGESGIMLSVENSAKKIAEEMLKNAMENNKDVKIKLAVEEKEPRISRKTLDEMRINALLGQGKSNFAGSPKNRRYNIGVGAAKFNNIFIAPDEEFSFNKILGEVDAKAGYLPELVIKGDRTVPEYGGGLCQVSTTAFRAAIYSGLPITERRPHAYPVVYYNPQGMDATIYPPHPDLRFKNDTGGIILVQTKVIKNELIFNFFGTKQSRTIKIIGPNIYDRQPDGSMKAVFWREIYADDKLMKKEPFYSSYSSPAKFPHKNPLE